jgi:acyl-CoA thioester hydrolase
MINYMYELKMKVRSYECDFEAIVNNAVYQNYLEHTRHEFMQAHGFNVVEMHRHGIDTVVARIKIAFKNSLHDSDEFISKLNVKKEGVRYVFYQDIYRCNDNQLIIRAVVDIVCIIDGKLSECKELDNFLLSFE